VGATHCVVPAAINEIGPELGCSLSEDGAMFKRMILTGAAAAAMGVFFLGRDAMSYVGTSLAGSKIPSRIACRSISKSSALGA
jgi:hypothetical protein